jgi:methyl-accepting chemotaxis protein
LQKVLLLTEKSSQTIDSTTEVRNIVADIEEKMGAINVILQSISEISEQTNMLSLNASIEAARAGEHGRGFAVVANEVRKLAEQSKTSAIEIKQILDTIKLVVSKAVEAMNKTQTVVNEQESAVEETKEIFNEILNSVHTLAEKVKEVKVNVVESEHNKERAVKEIESISSVSQQVAASSEEVSASAEEIAATMGEFTNYAQGLQQLSQQLDEEINKFKLR